MLTFLFYSVPGFMGLAFLASLTLYIQPDRALYLRYLPWFMLISFLFETYNDYLAYHSRNNILLTTIGGILAGGFYLFTLYAIIRNPKMKKFLIYALPVYVLISIIDITVVKKIGVFHSTSYATACLLIVAACIYYFYEILQQPHAINLMREPAFWICSGLLFYYACSFPLFGLLNFVKFSKTDTLVRNLLIVLVLLNIFLNLSFTIAFLCRLKIRKSM